MGKSEENGHPALGDPLAPTCPGAKSQRASALALDRRHEFPTAKVTAAPGIISHCLASLLKRIEPCSFLIWAETGKGLAWTVHFSLTVKAC